MSGANQEVYPLSAKIGPVPVTVGRGPDAELRLLESTISRRHATLTRINGTIVVEDHESRFGTFVNGDRIRNMSLGREDRVRFGSVVTYRVDADGLALDEAAYGISLTAAGLSVSRGARRLLEGIGFQIDSDRFVGILGPSGAGKSTLLNCLATYLPPAGGRIVYDGRVDLLERRDEYRAALGHVPQENLVYGALTARENLTFAARLRLDETRATIEIEDQVDRVLEEVGLTSHADKLAQVLSGGQRKRLSVAIELLKRPRLLLLDEPTSGLDPAAEANLMEEFRHVARRGTTVVCTTHLMDNLRLFDSVLVLGVCGQVGRLAYAGPSAELFRHFDCRGFADLYEKLETGRFTPLGGENPLCVPTESAPPSTRVMPRSGTVSVRAKPDTDTNISGAVLQIAQLVTATTDKNTWRQISCLLQRTRLSIGRDRGLLAAMALQPIGLGLLNCLSQASAPRGASMLFFMVVIAIWLGLNNSARDLVRERKLYIRERLAGLRPGAYLASKWLAHTAIGAIQILLLLLLFRLWLSCLPQGALSDELGRTSSVWMFCVLMGAYTGALGIGLLLSAAVQTEEAAVAALPLLIMPQLLISPIGVGRGEDILYTAHTSLPFHPLGVKLLDREWLAGIDGLVDFLSLGCFSRPALLLIKEPVIASGFGRLIWLADLGHLVVLVLGIWILTVYFFKRAEERWTRLIGVG